MKQRRVHDGIVGLVIGATTFLGMFYSPMWLWVPLVLGLVLFSSAFTGFCPLYFILSKTMKND